MGTAVKIGVIGAGSAVFSMHLVRDLCLTEELSGSTVVFMDVDEHRLATVHRLAERYAAEIGAQLTFEQTLERREALYDADFVINTALLGGHGRKEAQRALETAHGYYRGLRLRFHQLKLMLDVARDIERYCPNAWLIQSGNPVFEGCTLMTRETTVNVVGLCHGHYHTRDVARVLGLDLEHVTTEAPGFNHCIWMTHFRYKGEDAYPLLDEWIETRAEAYWRDWQPAYGETQMSPAAVHMYRMYDLFPIGDTARALWDPLWWYHVDLETKKRWYGPLGGFDSEIGWSLYLEQLGQRVAQIRHAADSVDSPLTELLPPEKSREQIVPIIDALTNDRPGTYQVNVPNNGAIPNIPDDVVVEVPAMVSGSGIQPLQVGPLPERLMLGVMIPRLLVTERALAAFLTGDRRYLYDILLSDHRTRSLQQAEEVLQAVFDMPGNEDLAEHFATQLPLTGL